MYAKLTQVKELLSVGIITSLTSFDWAQNTAVNPASTGWTLFTNGSPNTFRVMNCDGWSFAGKFNSNEKVQ